MARVSAMYWVYSRWWRECKEDVKVLGTIHSLHLELDVLDAGEAIGVTCVGVKCVDIRRNTSGEGGLMDSN